MFTNEALMVMKKQGLPAMGPQPRLSFEAKL
jgi:hypothetical protein